MGRAGPFPVPSVAEEGSFLRTQEAGSRGFLLCPILSWPLGKAAFSVIVEAVPRLQLNPKEHQASSEEPGVEGGAQTCGHPCLLLHIPPW